MITLFKVGSYLRKNVQFLGETCPFLCLIDSRPLIEFSTSSWHPRSRRRKPLVKSHLSVETRPSFPRGDVSKVGVAQINAFLMQKQKDFLYKTLNLNGFCKDLLQKWRLWGPVAKRKIVNHFRVFPTAQLMLGDAWKLYERSWIDQT